MKTFLDQTRQTENQADQTTQETIQIQPKPEPSDFDKSYNEGKEVQENSSVDIGPQEQIKPQPHDPQSSDIHSKIAEKVSTKITSKINANFIAPLASSLVSQCVNFAASGLEQALEKDVHKFKAKRRTVFIQNEDINNDVPDEFKQAHKDEKVMKEVEKDIEDFKDGEKVGVQHLGSVSDALGVQIIVKDKDGNIISVIGDGKPIEVRYEDGHYTRPDGTEPPVKSSNNNDCLFDVIADQTGGNPSEMRMKTVEALKANVKSLAHQHNDVVFLKVYDSEALHMGGFKPKRAEVIEYKEGAEEILEDAGTYREMKKKLRRHNKIKNSKRKGKVDLHHIPATAVTKEDREEAIVIPVDHLDHKENLSTKSKDYRDGVAKIHKTNPAEAVLMDLIDLQKTSLITKNADYEIVMNKLVEKLSEEPKAKDENTPKIGRPTTTERIPRTQLFNTETANVLKDKITKFPKENEKLDSKFVEQELGFKFTNNPAHQLLKAKLDGTLNTSKNKNQNGESSKQNEKRKADPPEIPKKFKENK